MVVLGIDPGCTVTAFGVVRSRRGRFLHLGSGFVRTKSKDPMGDRLTLIHGLLRDALATYSPDAVSIEAIFRHKSSESALRLGQARGVALLAAARLIHRSISQIAPGILDQLFRLSVGPIEDEAEIATAGLRCRPLRLEFRILPHRRPMEIQLGILADRNREERVVTTAPLFLVNRCETESLVESDDGLRVAGRE